jgi:hypothetical protein
MQGGWPGEAKKYLKPASYKKAEQQVNSSAPNLGSDKLVYDGKYNQILWSIKKLGIPDNVAFLDDGQESVAEGKLNEIRDQLWTWVQSKFPRTQWPEYVQRDFLYQQAKGIRNQAELDDFLKRNRNDFGKVQWRLEKLPITMDIFTPKTQRMIKEREGGSSNPYQVPKDAERHALQQKMIQQKGVSQEPIIVAKLSNGYDLIEGWHRTIQQLKAFPQGYTGPAWVGYGATYTSESVEQGVTEGAPIVVALPPIDVRNPKKAPQSYRNQGDIVPPTKPPSTEKRGVKGRPGQRPMPTYESLDYLDEK